MLIACDLPIHTAMLVWACERERESIKVRVCVRCVQASVCVCVCVCVRVCVCVLSACCRSSVGFREGREEEEEGGGVEFYWNERIDKLL